MIGQLRRIVGVAALTLLVLAAAVVALLAADQIHRPPRPLDPGIASIDTTRHGRLFILLVDSWRQESALDSTLFPQLAALRTRGASIPLSTVYEGFTIPAVRAAFSGYAETQLVNVVQNFRFNALPIESFFRDVHGLGKRTLVVAREPFIQFGPVFEQRYPQGRLDQYALDAQRPDIAISGWRSGAFDIVVLHHEAFDWVAHEVGIKHPRYFASAKHADSLIAQVAALADSSDYVLVLGDHGHNERGEHKTGFDIPTFALLLGPEVVPGSETAQLETTNIRYLVSHSMGLTLRPARYAISELARVIPVTTTPTDSLPSDSLTRRWTKVPTDYLYAAVVLAAGIALAWWLVLGTTGASLTATGWLVALAVFIPELVMRDALAALGALLRPGPLSGVVVLYAVGIVAKLVTLRDRGATPWWGAAGVNTLIVLVEFSVLAHPILVLSLAGVWGVLAWRHPAPWARRIALIAALQTLLYYTLRLPLYLFAIADIFFLLAYHFGNQARLTSASRRTLLHALLVVGSFTITSSWLAGSLEWGFLYDFFPAHQVELEVQRFLPIILAKIPLLLLTALVIARQTVTRELMQVVLLMSALRFGSLWIMRLAGSPTAEIWPLAEQGAYLTTYVLAIATWDRLRNTATDTASPSPA